MVFFFGNLEQGVRRVAPDKARSHFSASRRAQRRPASRYQPSTLNQDSPCPPGCSRRSLPPWVHRLSSTAVTPPSPPTRLNPHTPGEQGTADTLLRVSRHKAMRGGSKPIDRKLAIPLALAGMWLLACLGVDFFLDSSPWSFIALRGYDATTLGQIGAFFLGWTGAQLPAAGLAGIIIGSSDFTHPVRATFWTAFGYHLFASAVRVARWPWPEIHELDQSIPALAYVASTLLLVAVSVFVAWLTLRWHRFCETTFPQ